MFSQSQTAKKLKDLLKKRVNRIDFDEKWQNVVADFSPWESSTPVRTTSNLNVRLEFLARVCAVFSDVNLYRDEEIVSLMLSDSGTRNVGESFTCKTPSQRTEMVKVVRRELTERFGILYTLETQDGSRFTHEFFD